MNDKKSNATPMTAEQHGLQLAKTIIASFTGALNKQAALNGGYLPKPALDSLAAAYNGQVPKLAKKITATINDFSENSIRDMWDPSRTSAFERVLVKQFSHMIRGDAEVAMSRKFLARRALSGIFMCVRMMIGPEKIEVYEQDAFLIMQRVRDDNEDNFSWETVYADKRISNMVRDLLVGIEPYFANLNKRVDWMLPIINSHLSPVDDNSPVAEWQMTPIMLVTLINELYGSMWGILDNEQDRLRLIKQHGADKVKTLINLRSRLSRAS
jgi:hypothetical protein